MMLEFLEAAKGCTKEIQYPKHAPCETCNGSGAAKGSTPVTCNTCGGHGEVVQRQMFLSMRTTCPSCGGKGKVIKDPCSGCSGSGRSRVMSKLKVHVPPGVDNGMQIHLGGQGDLGDPGGPPGDLRVTIRVKAHEFFQRDGLQVLTQVPISYPKACLGGELVVQTIDGEETVKIPVGTPSGKVFKLDHKGIADPHGRGRGDHHVQVVVSVPTSLSPREEELIRELAKIADEKVPEKEKSVFKDLFNRFTS